MNYFTKLVITLVGAVLLSSHAVAMNKDEQKQDHEKSDRLRLNTFNNYHQLNPVKPKFR